MKKTLRKYIDTDWLWRWGAAIAGVTVAILSWLLGRNQSLWFDESYSIMLAKQPISELLSLTAVDAHPPVYYLVLHVWGNMFGWHDDTLRLLSAMCVGIAVAVCIVVVRYMTSARVALTMSPLVLLLPFTLRYGYEVRMYGLMMLIAAIATLILVVAQRTNRWRYWIIYAMLVALGMYTLYMSAAVWFGHLLWLCLVSYSKKGGIKQLFHQRWVVAYVMSVAIFLPYFISVTKSQLEHSALPGVGVRVGPSEVLNSYNFLLFYQPTWATKWWMLTLGFILLGVIVWLIVLLRRQAKQYERRAVWLFACIFVGAFLFFTITSLPPLKPVYNVRYMAHVAIFGYVFIALLVALSLSRTHPRKSIMVAVACLVLAIQIIGVYKLYQSGNFNFERMQQLMGRQVRESFECTPSTAIVLYDSYTAIDLSPYLVGCTVYYDTHGKKPDIYGGYVPLRNNPEWRLESSSILNDYQRVVYIHWGKQKLTMPDGFTEYRTETFDKSHVTFYEQM